MSDLSAAAADFQPADMDARERERQWAISAMEAQRRAVDQMGQGGLSAYGAHLLGYDKPAAPLPAVDPPAKLRGRCGILGKSSIEELVWQARQAGHAISLDFGPGWLFRSWVIRGPESVLRKIHAWLEERDRDVGARS